MFKLSKRLILIGSLLVLALAAYAQEPTIGLSSSEELGSYLVGPDGMTVYLLTFDPVNETVCYDQCAVAWPPVIVESADALTAAEGIPGTLGTTEREDGSLQVTYNGIPLYYWFRDEAPGDTTGHGVDNVWWVVPPATVYAQRIPELGYSLVGPEGMTLYIFTNDTPGEASVCSGGCATAWPPLTVESAEAIVPGVNLTGELGTVENADGSLQVTFDGWPLYYWQGDSAIGDATGEGNNDVWFTVSPPAVSIGSNDELGEFLVASNGMTLYKFDNDTEGVSNCSGGCLEAWPPYTVFEDTRLTLPEGATGELGTAEGPNGQLILTYNGLPLYFWQDDAAVGDTTGQGVGGVWWVVAP